MISNRLTATLIVVLVNLTSFLCLCGIAAGEWAHPNSGIAQDSVSYDIDSYGRVLRLDEITNTVDVLGRIDVGERGMMPFLCGRSIVEDDVTYLLLADINWDLHVFSTETRKLEPIPVRIDFRDTTPVLPMRADTVFIQFDTFYPSKFTQYKKTTINKREEGTPDTYTLVKLILDLKTRTVRGTFDFNIFSFPVFESPVHGRYISIFGEWAHFIEKIDIKTGELIEEPLIRDIWDVGNDSDVVTVNDGFAVVIDRDRDNDTCLFCLINIAKRKIVAQSQTLPLTYGRGSLFEDQNGTRMFELIELKSPLEPTGKIARFKIEGDAFVALPDTVFDPEKKKVVRKPDGSLAVIPKRKPSYLSMFEIEKKLSKYRYNKRKKEMGPLDDGDKAEIRRIIADFDKKQNTSQQK